MVAFYGEDQAAMWGNKIGIVLILMSLPALAGCTCNGYACMIAYSQDVGDLYIGGQADLEHIKHIRVWDKYEGSPNHRSIDQNYFSLNIVGFRGFEARQQRQDWCWAAAISMVMKYHGIPVSQCAALEALGYNCRSPELQFGNQSSIALAIKTINARKRSHSPLVDARTDAYGDGTPIFDDLANNLPAILGMKPRKGEELGHVYVLLGINYSWIPIPDGKPVIWYATVFDPLQNRRIKMSGHEFRRKLNFIVRVSVQDV